ncbi:hypothetical protein K9853_00565, partial [Lacticaseibacillus paracasei]
ETDLKPRKLKGEMSEGMLLSAESLDGKKITLLEVSENLENGSLVG